MFHNLDNIQKIQRWAASVESAQQRANIEVVNGKVRQWGPFVELRKRMFQDALRQHAEFLAKRIQDELSSDGPLKLNNNDSFVVAVQPQFGNDVLYRLKMPSGEYFPSRAGQRGFIFESKIESSKQAGTWTYEWSTDGGLTWSPHSSSIIVHVAFRCGHCLKTVIGARDGDCRCHAFPLPRPLKRLRVPPTLRQIPNSLKSLLLDAAGALRSELPADIRSFTFTFEDAQQRLVDGKCISDLIDYVRLFMDAANTFAQLLSAAFSYDVSLPFEVQPYPTDLVDINHSRLRNSKSTDPAGREFYEIQLRLVQAARTGATIIELLQTFPRDDEMTLEALFERFRVPLTVTDQTKSNVLAQKLLNRLQSRITTITEVAYIPALQKLAYGPPVSTLTAVKPLFNVDTEYDLFEDRQWLNDMADLERERRMCFGFNSQLNRWNCCGRERTDPGCRKFHQHVNTSTRTYDLANAMYYIITKPSGSVTYYRFASPKLAASLKAELVPLNPMLTETYDLTRGALEEAMKQAYESGNTLRADAMVMHANLHLCLNTPWNPSSIRPLKFGFTPLKFLKTLKIYHKEQKQVQTELKQRRDDLNEVLDEKKVQAAAAAAAAAAASSGKKKKKIKKPKISPSSAASASAPSSGTAPSSVSAASASALLSSTSPASVSAASASALSSSTTPAASASALSSSTAPASVSSPTTPLAIAPIVLPGAPAKKPTESKRSATTATTPATTPAAPATPATTPATTPAAPATAPAASLSVAQPEKKQKEKEKEKEKESKDGKERDTKDEKSGEAQDETEKQLQDEFLDVLPQTARPKQPTSAAADKKLDVFTLAEENKREEKEKSGDMSTLITQRFSALQISIKHETNSINKWRKDVLFNVKTLLRIDSQRKNLDSSKTVLNEMRKLINAATLDAQSRLDMRAIVSDTIRLRRRQGIEQLLEVLKKRSDGFEEKFHDTNDLLSSSANALQKLAQYPDAAWHSENWRLQLAATTRLLACYIISHWYTSFEDVDTGVDEVQQAITADLVAKKDLTDWSQTPLRAVNTAISAIQNTLKRTYYILKKDAAVVTKTKFMVLYEALVLANISSVDPYWSDVSVPPAEFSRAFDVLMGVKTGTSAVLLGLLDDGNDD